MGREREMNTNTTNYIEKTQTNENSITLSDIFRVIKKNWILMVIVTVFVFACGCIYTFAIANPTYKATSTVSVEVPTTSEKVSVSEAGNSVTASLRYVQSIADFVKSEAIMQAVSDRNKDIITYGKLKNSTTVSYDTTSIIVGITVTNEVHEYAQSLALDIAQELAKYSVDSKDESVADKYLCTIKVRDQAKYYSKAAPNEKLYLIVSGLAGLVLACVIVFIKEFASSKFQTPDEIKVLGYPIINTLVNDKSKDKKDNNSLINPTVRNFEPYNRLISNVKFANVDNPYKIIMFTSTVVDELKTTVCSNFAFTLVHNEKKVIILDLDTRKPRLHEVFNVERHNGIVEYLSGDLKIEDIIKHSDNGVDVISVGKEVTNPITLLESQKLSDLVKSLRDEYDYVVIDTPPLVVCNDAAIISNLSDCVIYNVAINQGKKKEIKAGLEQLSDAGANIIGINVTKANISDRGGYYYYYEDSDKK